MIKLCCKNPFKRPYLIRTPEGNEVGIVTKDKSVMIVDKNRDVVLKDKKGNIIITEGSVPEVYFEERPLTPSEILEHELAGEKNVIIEME